MPRMEADGTRLGPLELVDGCWVVGDTSRADTHWVAFRPDGLHQHGPDSEGQLTPWSRIMLGIWLTWGKHARHTNDHGVYTFRGMVATREGGWMHMTLRHPYEDVQLRFDQHARPYRAVDTLRLEFLLRQLIDDGKLHLLGDVEWVGRAVACLVGGKNSRLTQRALRRAAVEALATAGPGAP
ncbi:hypothetical protein ROS62_04695 [Streptomyces sp. DSM 41972]|uniref:Uncharacterized protein n=1 Tax=Streptomyces althioticus subsp. attaecolombicae TaxID=3075534 RepID=A0ABU3HU38_9ACTN|nr:hypothetical protein [Streptomyces sp. DSM 41972]SCD75389.1 hypothetical protein GA0115238_122868 [Streptomyces sp. di50b]SCD86079.1 hypothetical protein GA0115245_114768 [Streptomyces sp. di188]